VFVRGVGELERNHGTAISQRRRRTPALFVKAQGGVPLAAGEEKILMGVHARRASERNEPLPITMRDNSPPLNCFGEHQFRWSKAAIPSEKCDESHELDFS